MFNTPAKRILLILASLLVVAALIIGVFLSSRNSRIAGYETQPEGSSDNTADQSLIVDGSNILGALGSHSRYKSLTKDLYIYAKQVYPEYSKYDVVSFVPSGKPIKTNSEVKIAGSFARVSNKINITIKLLPNSRLDVSIKDTKTNKSIDELLPSNNKQNKYIASLPIDTETYTIGYNVTSETMNITLKSLNSGVSEAAIEQIKQATSGTSFDINSVVVQAPAGLKGPSPAQIELSNPNRRLD
jgi:hypothetical protein